MVFHVFKREGFFGLWASEYHSSNPENENGPQTVTIHTTLFNGMTLEC